MVPPDSRAWTQHLGRLWGWVTHTLTHPLGHTHTLPLFSKPCLGTHSHRHRHPCTHCNTHTDTREHLPTQITQSHLQYQSAHTYTHHNTQANTCTHTHQPVHTPITHTHTCTYPRLRIACTSTLRHTHARTPIPTRHMHIDVHAHTHRCHTHPGHTAWGAHGSKGLCPQIFGPLHPSASRAWGHLDSAYLPAAPCPWLSFPCGTGTHGPSCLLPWEEERPHVEQLCRAFHLLN